jgi:multiple sugar transport system permease protein
MAVATTTAAAAGTRRSRHLAGHVIFYVVLILGALLFLGPMLWALLSSFKPEDEFYTTFWPSHFTVSAYTSSFAAVPYLAHAFFVSALDYGVITVCSLVFSSMAGYALARLSFIGRSFLLNLILFTMTIPAMLTLVPLYILVANFFGWSDSYMGIIGPALVSPLGIFLFRQFFSTLPAELFEAGRIDGMSDLGMLFRIAWPLSKGVVLTVGVLVFMQGWDDFLWPLVVEHDQAFQTASQAVGIFVTGGAGGGHQNWQMAMAVVLALPVIVAYLIAQKHIVEGIATTGLK